MRVRAVTAACILLTTVPVGAGKPVAAPRPGEPAETGRPPAGENYLGVFTEPLPAPLAAQLARFVRRGEGLIVTRIVPGSPAEKAGLKQFDVLTSYAGHRLNSSRQLTKLILAGNPNRPARLHYIRAARPATVEVQPGRRPAGLAGNKEKGERKKDKLLLWGMRTPVGAEDRRSTSEERGARIAIPHPSSFIPHPSAGLTQAGANSPLTTHQEDAPSAHRPTGRLLVTSTDGATYELEVRLLEGGKADTVQRLQCTEDKLADELRRLPAGLRDDVQRQLGWIEKAKENRRGVHCRLHRCKSGETPAVRLTLVRTAGADRVRVFELDQPVSAERPLSGGDLLKIDAFSKELQDLPEPVRLRIEETLRESRLPQVTVGVKRSQ